MLNRQEIVNFIMAGAGSEDEEQELVFPFDEEDIDNALATVRDIASAEPTPKRRRRSLGGKKRGPEPSKVSAKFYHLPPISTVPRKLGLEDPDVKRHGQNGYGYRSVDSKGPCPDSLVVNDDTDGFEDFIGTKHPMLNGDDYYLYRLTKGRKLKEFDIHTTRELKDAKYQGTIFVYSSASGHHQDAVVSATVDERTEQVLNERFDDLNDLHSKLNGKMHDTQEILVNREDIITDAIEYYTKNPDIINCKLYVSFVGESGDDFMGLTREFFSEFWRLYLNARGANEQVNLEPNPLVLDESYHQAVGRILVHGYVVTGFLPTRLNTSTLYRLLSGREPSTDLCVTSYLKSIVPGERSFIEEKLKETATFDIDEKVRLATIFESFRLPGIPNGKDDLFESICRIGKVVSWVGPSYAICQMRSGCSLLELQALDEDSLKNYLAKLKCTGPNIANIVDPPTFSSDPVMAEMEKKVYEYLQRYLQGLCSQKSEDLLRFVTGHEVITGRITVEFNGNSNRELMIPKSHTCGMVIELSKFVNSYSNVYRMFKRVLSCAK